MKGELSFIETINAKLYAMGYKTRVVSLEIVPGRDNEGDMVIRFSGLIPDVADEQLAAELLAQLGRDISKAVSQDTNPVPVHSALAAGQVWVKKGCSCKVCLWVEYSVGGTVQAGLWRAWLSPCYRHPNRNGTIDHTGGYDEVSTVVDERALRRDYYLDFIKTKFERSVR